MDIGGVQTSLAAVGARPLRTRADQAYAGAAGVVVHFPAVAEEGADVVFGEEVRRPMRAVEHADLPFAALCPVLSVPALFIRDQASALRDQRLGQPGQGGRVALGEIGQRQGVATAQRTAGMAAELAQGEGRARAQILRAVDAAGDQQIAARASGDLAQTQGAASGDLMYLPQGKLMSRGVISAVLRC